MMIQRKWYRLLSQLFLLTLLLIGIALPMTYGRSQTIAAQPPSPPQTPNDPQQLDRQGRQHYEAAQYSEAIGLWQTAIDRFITTGDRPRQAQTLSNLSLAYQQLGQWDKARDTIDQSLALLLNTKQTQQLAQTLDILGRLQLATGQADTALTTWKQAAAIYKTHRDTTPLTRNQINQAQALQSLGLYTQAQRQLAQALQTLQAQPDAVLKAIGLRSLGNVLRMTGNLTDAQATLQQSLTVAQAINSPPDIGEALLGLGHIATAQEDNLAALTLYQKAATYAPRTAIPAQLRQLDLLIKTKQLGVAQQLLPQLLAQIDRLPPSRTAIYARITYAQCQIKLAQPPDRANLTLALAQARSLQDARAESAALGTLGRLYEQTQQWPEATRLTQRALQIAQTLNAADITYQWQWQLGRLLRQQQDIPGAIEAYGQAIHQLQAIRYDLVTINPDVQFSFRDQVEPAYRQFVDLLLQPGPGLEPSQANLRQARDTIEALQLAELDDYFRAACLTPKQQLDSVVDQADPTAAIIHTSILSDRIEVILKLPHQPLRHYSSKIPKAEVEQKLAQLRRDITEPDALRPTQAAARQLYNWLIQPSASAIAQSQVKTLVFVLDGMLRNIPMAALYDGQHYLIENYAVAISPSLQLFAPQPLPTHKFHALAVGINQARLGFSRLPYVTNELTQIKAKIPSQILLNQQFTSLAFQAEVNAQPFSIVHLATHGRFSSKASETFVLAWDKTINVNEMDTLLRSRDQKPDQTLELLVLSACSTAAGDNRAALGLAGVAWRAGARSTIASLWNVNDQSTALLMAQFYQSLSQDDTTRAEALRQAQLALLKTPEYQLPLFWSPYVLIGNWL
jgi:CHAT domain-containing protein